MNEEIERLLRLANIKDDDGYNTTDLTTSLQLFSELIVRECAGKVDNILRAKTDGGGTMGDEIREYFGVE